MRRAPWAIASMLLATVYGVAPGQDRDASPRLDFHGDALPPGALVRLGSARLRHGHNVMAVAFSPDGSMLASAAWDHTVRLWDPATGKELRTLTEGERDAPYSTSRWNWCLAFSPDGKRLACGEHAPGWSASTVRIWDVAGGKLLRKFSGEDDEGVLSLAFTPDGGTLVTGSVGFNIRFWDPDTGKERRGPLRYPVQTLAFDRDGKVLALAGGLWLQLWNPVTQRAITQCVGHTAVVEAVSFSKDGKLIVTGSQDGTVRLWDVTGKAHGVLRGHKETVLSVCFAPNGQTVASAGTDRTIRLWDVATLKMTACLEGHQKEVRGICFSPDGKTLASAAADQRVALWDVVTGKEKHARAERPGHQAPVAALRFIDERTLVTVGRDQTIRWWNWRTGKQERSVEWEDMPGRAVAFRPDGRVLALGTQRGAVRFVNTTSGESVQTDRRDLGTIVSLAFSADGKRIAAGDNIQARVWDTTTNKLFPSVQSDGDSLQLMLFAPDGKLLLGGIQSSRLVDPSDAKVIRQLPLPVENIKSGAFSPDGRVLAVGNTSGEVELWDTAKGVQLRTQTGLAGYVQALAFSPDGRLLAAGGWRGIKVWELETGYERCGFHGYEGDVFALAFTRDGRALAAAGGDTNVLIWDMTDGALAEAAPRTDKKLVPTLWQDLAGVDGHKANRAIWRLVARADDAVAHLRAQLKPAAPVAAEHLARLIADLGSAEFAVRQKATQELHNLGELAEPALAKIVADPPSLEVGRRAEGVLQRLGKIHLTAERLQAARAIETLEYLGTPEAHWLLRELSRGAPTVRITREARAALDRLGERKPSE